MTALLTSDQVFIRKLTEIVLANLENEAFNVKELASKSGISLHGLNRRLNSIINKTANQFIREVRLQKAMEMIKNESLNANEIADKVGFRSAAYFNICFSEYFGFPPGKVKKENFRTSKRSFFSSSYAKRIRNKPIRRIITLFLPLSLLLCVLAGIILLIANYIQDRRYSKALTKTEKSIAVLPFINDSPDNENIYFINGIMDKVLNDLQFVTDFRVISRTSVEQFRNSKIPIPEIAKKLRVNYVVEGSGQKYGNLFNVNVQLIKASDENHLWSKTFEKEIKETKDIFEVQSSIALSVASALKATINPEEKLFINMIPTANLTAYDFYLRGNEYWANLKVLPALDMYSMAIGEDSIFAAAYAKRAEIYSYLFWVRNKELQGNDLKARDDIKRCTRLNPELPEVRFAQAIAYYMLDRDYNNALKILKDLKANGPDRAEAYAYYSYILRRQGKWQESISETKHSIDLDPFNANYIANLSDTYQLMHQNYNQIKCLKDGLSSIPDCKLFRYFIFDAYLNKNADMKSALKETELVEEDIPYQVYYYTRQYDKLIGLIHKNESKINIEYNNDDVQGSEQYYYHPRTYNLALIYSLCGNKPLCKVYADSAITDLKDKIKENPGDERYYATLGKCYALTGKNIEAVNYGMKAVSMMPIKLDALRGANIEQDLMEIYVFTSDDDKALNKIEYLLSSPSWLSVGKLMIDPIFDKLRGLPRFHDIISSAAKRQNDINNSQIF